MHIYSFTLSLFLFQPIYFRPKDHNPPGSSVHGILQARVLEWGAIAFSDSCHNLFIHWPVDGTLAFFQFLIATNIAAFNSFAQVLVSTYTFIFSWVNT